MTRRLLLPLVAAALVLASCNGDDDATPTTTVTTVVTTAADTTVEDTAAPTTAVVPDTTSAETTTTTTTTTVVATTLPDTTVETTTTDSAPTTVPDGVPPRVRFPDDPDKQAVVDAVYAYFDALGRAEAAPVDPSLRADVASTVGEPVASRVMSYLDGLVEEGRAYLELGPLPSTIEVFEDVVGVFGESALVDACVVDRTTGVELAANPDGSDRVFDDTVVAAVLSYSLSTTASGWRVVDLEVVKSEEGQEQCD